MPKTVLAVLPLASRICAGQCTATTPEFHHRHPTWPDDELSPSSVVPFYGDLSTSKDSVCSPPARRRPWVHSSIGAVRCAGQSIRARQPRVPSSGMPCVAVKRLSVGNRIAGRESLAGRKRCSCALVATLPSHFGCRLGAETGARRRHGLAGSRLLLRSCRRSRRVHN